MAAWSDAEPAVHWLDVPERPPAREPLADPGDTDLAIVGGGFTGLWTAIRMSNALDFGCVWINTHIPLVAEMPHGGFKSSGHGKDLSMYGFEDYTRIKHVMIHHGFEG